MALRRFEVYIQLYYAKLAARKEK